MAEEKVPLTDDLSGNIDLGDPPKKSGIMSISLHNISAREWFANTRNSIQPWGEFVNTGKFKMPKSIAPVGKRVVKNVEKFQSNYVFIFMGLVIFCILTSPMLLIAIGVCLGACYIISLRNQENKLKIMGRELTLIQQYAAVGALSFPLFWLAGAGSAVFWVIGASFFVIMLHASLYQLQDELEGEAFDLVMEEV